MAVLCSPCSVDLCVLCAGKKRCQCDHTDKKD